MKTVIVVSVESSTSTCLYTGLTTGGSHRAPATKDSPEATRPRSLPFPHLLGTGGSHSHQQPYGSSYQPCVACSGDRSAKGGGMAPPRPPGWYGGAQRYRARVMAVLCIVVQLVNAQTPTPSPTPSPTAPTQSPTTSPTQAPTARHCKLAQQSNMQRSLYLCVKKETVWQITTTIAILRPSTTPTSRSARSRPGCPWKSPSASASTRMPPSGKESSFACLNSLPVTAM